MAAFQNFRSAFHGFNREDVVHYLEYINNKHTAQVNQLKNDLHNQKEELDALRELVSMQGSLTEELERLRREKAELENILAKKEAVEPAVVSELEETKSQLAEARTALAVAHTNSELEAYRRAERAERMAKDRVSRLYDQVNGALAEATACTDETAGLVATVSERIATQLAQLQLDLADSKNRLKDTAASMFAIRPLQDED